MMIDLHDVSVPDLIKLKSDVKKVLNFRLEYMVELDKFIILNEIFKINDLATLLIVLDMREQEDDEPAKPSLEVFQYLKYVRNLSIHTTFLSKPLINFDFIENIEILNRLGIRANVKKNIKLDPLFRFNKLNFFDYDCEGLNSSQHDFLNIQNSLEQLFLYDIDLSLINEMQFINELRVHRKLLNPQFFLEKFPNVEKLVLEKCKDLDIQSYIAIHDNLSSISLRYMSHITEIPKFKNPKKIIEFSALGLSKLNNIDAVLEMENLESLDITDNKILKCIDFEPLSSLKKLKRVNTYFNSVKENNKFDEFAKKNGWNLRPE